MKDLVEVPQWQEKELIIPYETNLTEGWINKFYNTSTTKRRKLNSVKKHKMLSCLDGKHNFLKEFILQKRDEEDFKIKRFVEIENVYLDEKKDQSHWKVFKVKESYLSFLKQSKLRIIFHKYWWSGKYFGEHKSIDLTEDVIKEFETAFKEIKSTAKDNSFDKSIESWIGRLMMESKLGILGDKLK